MTTHKAVQEQPKLYDVIAAFHDGNYRHTPLEFFVAAIAAWDEEQVDATADDVAVAANLVELYIKGEDDCTTCDDPNCEIRQAFRILAEYEDLELFDQAPE